MEFTHDPTDQAMPKGARGDIRKPMKETPKKLQAAWDYICSHPGAIVTDVLRGAGYSSLSPNDLLISLEFNGYLVYEEEPDGWPKYIQDTKLFPFARIGG